MPNFDNIARLREHLGRLRAEQIRMDKVLVIDKPEETLEQAVRLDCGTVGCIAGHAACLFGPPQKMVYRLPDAGCYMSNLDMTRLDSWWPTAQAQRSLELDEDEAGYMFYAAWAPGAPALADGEEWGDYDCTAHLPEVTPEQVLEYLDKVLAARDVFVSLEAAPPKAQEV